MASDRVPRDPPVVELVFLHGPPGVGKLTVARALAGRTGLRVFHNHLAVDLLTPVFEFGSDAFVELRERIWLSVFREAALSSHSLIFTFAPESTVSHDFPERCVATVERQGGRVVFVELTCAGEELQRRIEAPERAAWGKLDSAERYRELRDAGAFVYPPIPGAGPPIDTGALDPARAAAEIVARLGPQDRPR